VKCNAIKYVVQNVLTVILNSLLLLTQYTLLLEGQCQKGHEWSCYPTTL